MNVLEDRNMSLQLRLKQFNSCVGHMILFRTSEFPISKTQFQGKMLRRIQGWRRIEGEDWRDAQNESTSVIFVSLGRSNSLATNGDMCINVLMSIH